MAAEDALGQAVFSCSWSLKYTSSEPLPGVMMLLLNDQKPPPTPTATAATNVKTNGFRANWNSVSVATGYRLDVSTSSGFGSFVSGYNNKDVGNTTSQTISGLNPSTPYYYRVRAYNAGGTSSSSNVRSVTTTSGGVDPNFTNSLGMDFVYIEPDTFMMGSPTDEPCRYSDETQHQVTLTQGFYMQTTEVTQGQWKALTDSNPSWFSSCGDDCPVENVSWNDVQAFITALNAMGEGTYRLPTEAEWEYACRAGSNTAFANGEITEFNCGHDPNLDVMGWYCGNTGHTTHPVAQKQANAKGLYDMHGNVFEWTADWYGSYPSSSVTDPEGPSSGSYRVMRGGCFDAFAVECRSAIRGNYSPDYGNGYLGFRLVLAPGY